MTNLEAKAGKRETSTLMLGYPPELSKAIQEWAKKNIKDEDLFINPEKPTTSGRETEIHTTVQSSLKDITAEQAEKFLSGVKGFFPLKVKTGKISKFTTKPERDTIILLVESKELKELHNLLHNFLENSDEFPDYTPHITLAFVKKGSCEDLVGSEELAGTEADISELIFSDEESNHTPIKMEASKKNPPVIFIPLISGGVRTTLLADKLTRIYRKAREAVEKDPKWANYLTDKSVAQQFGELQQALLDARSEGEIQKIWNTYKPTVSLEQVMSA